MSKYIATTTKDIKLLVRDIAGLAMLFGMPMVLIIVMTLLQDSTFKALEEKKLPIAIVNLDQDTFGVSIVEGLSTSKFFHVSELGRNYNSIEELKKQVTDGNYQIGIVINKDASNLLRNNIKYNILQQLPAEDSLIFGNDPISLMKSVGIDIYFDPITKNSFKQSIVSALNQYSSGVESKIMFEVYSSLFQELLGMEMRNQGDFSNLVDVQTLYAGDNEEFVPNSVQHNVPAWTIFAMFFIVIPLAGNIIKERESGISTRLRIIAGSNLPIILGKVTTFFFVGLIQAISMLLVGIFVLPLFGLPQLIIGGNYLTLLVLTASISLAASGYGVVIGTIASSQEQASIFGSISVVILAAIGGIWVPVFIMSDFMQILSMISPLNWALNGYYDVLLRNSGMMEIMPYMLTLIGFFAFCITIAWFVRNRREMA